MKNCFFTLAILLATAITAQNASSQYHPDQINAEDRICFALYTVHENTLKLTAQFYPIQGYEPFAAQLQVKSEGEWICRAESDIYYPGFTANFRIENWDDTGEHDYRVVHNNTAFYEGIIRKNPRDKEEFVMVVFTGNSVSPNHGGEISKQDIVENLKRLKPDLLFFSGDQVYNHSAHLTYWLKFGRDFGEIISNTPTISLPDDHDIGQGNLWGAGGKKARTRDGQSGGYYMPAAYVKEVERAQTSHLPDPYDPTPIDRGIRVYYTDLKWGGIGFAILEDRKFKSGPEGVLYEEGKRRETLQALGNDTRKFDVDGATLLGDRQLKFLDEWTTDWTDTEMKAVLSQTIFTMSSNYAGRRKNRIKYDFDSNGWPQTGRNKALSAIRKSYSCMLAGDQHLGSVIHHGIDNWNDAGYSFCTPSIANFWLRWWAPDQPGENRQKGAPDYTGEYLDGFSNKITINAVANPTLPEIAEGGKFSTRAAGFGIVKFNKTEREITFECWGRNVDITDPNSRQYEGWPITIAQTDNYLIREGYELPRLHISEADQVITVVNSQNGEVVTSLRIKGQSYQPIVPDPGNYDILIGESGQEQQLKNLLAKEKNKEDLKVTIR